MDLFLIIIGNETVLFILHFYVFVHWIKTNPKSLNVSMFSNTMAEKHEIAGFKCSSSTTF